MKRIFFIALLSLLALSGRAQFYIGVSIPQGEYGMAQPRNGEHFLLDNDCGKFGAGIGAVAGYKVYAGDDWLPEWLGYNMDVSVSWNPPKEDVRKYYKDFYIDYFPSTVDYKLPHFFTLQAYVAGLDLQLPLWDGHLFAGGSAGMGFTVLTNNSIHTKGFKQDTRYSADGINFIYRFGIGWRTEGSFVSLEWANPGTTTFKASTSGTVSSESQLRPMRPVMIMIKSGFQL